MIVLAPTYTFGKGGHQVLPDTTLTNPEQHIVREKFICAEETTSLSIGMVAQGQDYPVVQVDVQNPNPDLEVDVRIVKAWYKSTVAYNDLGFNDFSEKLAPQLLLHDDNLITVDTGTETHSIRRSRPSGDEYVVGNRPLEQYTGEILNSGALLDPVNWDVRDATTLQPFAMAMDKTRQLWISIKPIAGAAPGPSTVVFTLTYGSGTQSSITVTVNVLEYVLEASSIERTIYYRSQLGKRGAHLLGSEIRSIPQMTAELRNLKDHGVKNPSLYQPIHIDSASLADGLLLDMRERAMEIRQAEGMTGGPLYDMLNLTNDHVYGALPDQPQNIANTLPQVQAMASSYGYSEVYMAGTDEASGSTLTEQRPAWDAVHVNGGKVIAAGRDKDNVFGLMGDIQDIYVHGGNNGDTSIPDPVQPDSVNQWHAVGHKVFLYNRPQTPVETNYLHRFSYGLMLWANGYDGAMPYAYMHIFGTPWNDVDAPASGPKFRNHCYVYPTSDGVIDTMAWEAFREGGQDIQYVEKLEREIARIGVTPPGNKFPPVETPATDASKFLDELRAFIINQQNQTGKYSVSIGLNMDSVRTIVQGYIKELRVL